MQSAYYISDDDFNKVNERSKVNKNDVLISMIGTVGEVYRVAEDPDYAIKNLGLFKVSDDVKSKYLYYYLQSNYAHEYICSHQAGSTQQYISLGNLRNMPIRLPDSQEVMEKIVDILSSFDKKIELNTRINKKLNDLSECIINNMVCISDSTILVKDFVVSMRNGSTPRRLTNTGIMEIFLELKQVK